MFSFHATLLHADENKGPGTISTIALKINAPSRFLVIVVCTFRVSVFLCSHEPKVRECGLFIFIIAGRRRCFENVTLLTRTTFYNAETHHSSRIQPFRIPSPCSPEASMPYKIHNFSANNGTRCTNALTNKRCLINLMFRRHPKKLRRTQGTLQAKNTRVYSFSVISTSIAPLLLIV